MFLGGLRQHQKVRFASQKTEMGPFAVKQHGIPESNGHVAQFVSAVDVPFAPDGQHGQPVLFAEIQFAKRFTGQGGVRG